MQRNHAQARRVPRALSFVTVAAALLGTTALGACRNGPGETEPYTEIDQPTERIGANGPGVNTPVEGELPPGAALAGGTLPPGAALEDRDRPPVRDPIAPGEAGMTTQWHQQMMAACPMLVEDVTVEYESIPDGAAIKFTTPNSEEVADLRGRVEQLAQFYEPPQQMRGMLMWQHHQHMRDAARRHDPQLGQHRHSRQGVAMDQPVTPGQPGQPGRTPPPQPDQIQPDQIQPDPAQPDPGQVQRGQQILSPAEVEVEQIEDGARVVFKPLHSGDLTRVRRQVQSHQQRFAGGECLLEMPVHGAEDQP